jgi:hypothetical protein
MNIVKKVFGATANKGFCKKKRLDIIKGPCSEPFSVKNLKVI